ncbi:MAG: hypothetical protein ACOYK7_06680 [Pirellulales bacterium]
MTDSPATTEHDRTRPDRPTEGGWVVWLRANARPVWLATLTQLAVVGGAWALIARGVGLPPWGAWSWLAVVVDLVAVGLAGGALVTAWCSLLPRLEHRGGRLRVRLAPGWSHDVPVDIVECFFLGSDSLTADGLGAADGTAATHRVGTLVMRIAEREAERWRPVDTRGWPRGTAWGRWQDGAIVLDGRWCEPLSVEVARRLSGVLIAARRAVPERGMQHGGVET